jgi:hypothetical protein
MEAVEDPGRPQEIRLAVKIEPFSSTQSEVLNGP